MLTDLFGVRDITLLSVIVRILAAFVCGGLIGLERSYKNRAAGFRTHILVALAACLASMTGMYLYLNAGLATDISRIPAQVVSGLGFIGAGTIIVAKRPKVTGLTTAAGLWASGVIGIALGAGFYEGAVAATVLILIAQVFLSQAEQHIPDSPEFKIGLRYRRKPALDEVLRTCKDRKLTIENLQVTKLNGDDDYDAVISLRPRKKVDREALLTRIRTMDDIEQVTELPQKEF